jgi:hypothetical protein
VSILDSVVRFSTGISADQGCVGTCVGFFGEPLQQMVDQLQQGGAT